METISKHELVPFTALMNMIKFNYIEKKEVFSTLLGILCDYDPTDEENRKRTTRYIELLLSDQADLAEYLLSFLPNGMSVDHIGVAEIKVEKIKLKKKKHDKLHQTSFISTPSSTISKTVVSCQQSVACSGNEGTTTNSKPIPPQVNLNIIHRTVYPADKTTNTLIEPDSSTEGHTSVLDFSIKDQNDNLQKTKTLPISNCNLKASMGVISSKMNTVVNSTQVLSSNLPVLYFNNAQQTPVCPVVPSMKLQNVIPKSSSSIPSTYTSNLCDWVPYYTNTVPKQNKHQTTVYTNTCKESSQDKPRQTSVATFAQINEDTDAQNLISSTVDLLYEGYDLPSYNIPPENLHFVQQHDPLLPNVRFPLHSTPNSNHKLHVADVAFSRRPRGHDLNQPMNEHRYQPFTFSDVNMMVDRNMDTNSRTLSAFPYTQEFVFPDGKTQNLFLNRSGVSTDQNTYQNISKATSFNKNKPCSTYEKSNAPVYNELPRHNMTGTIASTYTKVFNQNQIMVPRFIQNNTRQFLSPPTQNINALNLPRSNILDDMLTPFQYNPELNFVDPTLSNQDYDVMNQLNRPKPKKLSMSANSSVRKKLRLTPNNTNVPQ